MPADLVYILLLFGLLVVPKFLQRFRVPPAVSALVFGAGAAAAGQFEHDPTIVLLATFGIVALFLLAGLEVDADDLRRGARTLVPHLLAQVLAITLASWAAEALFKIERRAAILLALALFTPSTGFILDSLDSFGLDETERFLTRTKAIASELVALAVMFFVLQSTSAKQLALSSLALAALVVAIPLALRVIATRLVPHAPRSEFAFLVMVAVVCAYATKKLGVYYLVGAFLVGAAAQRFRRRLPELSSERMLHAIEAFASLFVPFYFFKAGLGVRVADLGPWSLVAGLGFLVVCLPVRVGLVVLHRRLLLHEPARQGMRVGVAILPTLVFSLVIAEILRERFGLPAPLFGGLILYALVDTVAPGILLRRVKRTDLALAERSIS